MKYLLSGLIVLLFGCTGRQTETAESIKAKLLAHFIKSNAHASIIKQDMLIWKNESDWRVNDPIFKNRKWQKGDTPPVHGVVSTYYFHPNALIIMNLKCENKITFENVTLEPFKHKPCGFVHNHIYYYHQQQIISCSKCGFKFDFRGSMARKEVLKFYPNAKIIPAIQFHIGDETAEEETQSTFSSAVEVTAHYLRSVWAFDNNAYVQGANTSTPNTPNVQYLSTGLWREKEIFYGMMRFEISNGKLTVKPGQSNEVSLSLPLKQTQ